MQNHSEEIALEGQYLESIQNLAEQITTLQKHLNPNTQLYSRINKGLEKVLRHRGKPRELPSLFKLQSLLNNEQNSAEFSKSKKQRLIQEINLSILILVQEKISLDYQIKITNAIKAKHLTTTSFSKKSLFILIALIGTIFAAINGASVISSITGALSILNNTSNLFLIPAQLAFAGIAVLAFYTLELNSIGKPLGIRVFDLGHIFKLYDKQSIIYENTISMLQNAVNKKLDVKELGKLEELEELEKLKNTAIQLKGSYNDFKQKIAAAKKAQEKPSLFKSIVTTTCTTIAAGVFGSLGALMAHGFITSNLPLIIGASAATGPIGFAITIAFMTACFTAAAVWYVCLERKAMMEFVNKAWGTPTKIVSRLVANDELIERNYETLERQIDFAMGSQNLWNQGKSRFHPYPIQSPGYGYGPIAVRQTREGAGVSEEKSPQARNVDKNQEKTNTVGSFFQPSRPYLPTVGGLRTRNRKSNIQDPDYHPSVGLDKKPPSSPSLAF